MLHRKPINNKNGKNTAKILMKKLVDLGRSILELGKILKPDRQAFEKLSSNS